MMTPVLFSLATYNDKNWPIWLNKAAKNIIYSNKGARLLIGNSKAVQKKTAVQKLSTVGYLKTGHPKDGWLAKTMSTIKVSMGTFDSNPKTCLTHWVFTKAEWTELVDIVHKQNKQARSYTLFNIKPLTLNKFMNISLYFNH